MSPEEGSSPAPGMRLLATLAFLLLPGLSSAVICPDPSQEWSTSYNNVAANGDEWATGLAVYPNGDIVVVGAENVSGQGEDWFVRKYDAAGSEIWAQSYNNSSANGDDVALAVVLDPAGNIYVSGYEERTEKSGAGNWHVRKYASDGTPGPSTDLYGEGELTSIDDEARAIGVAVSGSVYVAGYRNVGDGTGKNWHIRRYSAGLGFDKAWAYDSPAHADDVINGLAVAGSGDIYFAGFDTRSDLTQGKDWLVRKYSGTTDTLLWARVFNGAAGGDDEAHAIAVGPEGNVYAAGSEQVTGQGLNWLVRAWDSSGNYLWSVSYGSPSNLNDEALAVAVDAAGNIVVAGYANRSDLFPSESDNWLIRKYRPDGSLAWTRESDGPDSGPDRVLAVATDGSSTVIVAGYEDAGTSENLNLNFKKYINRACLEPFFSFNPVQPSTGQWVTVVMTVSNAGSVDADEVKMAAGVVSGAVNLTVLSNPDLTATFYLAAGAGRAFTWTYSITGCGDVVFGATGTGKDALSAAPLLSVVSSTMQALCGARLDTDIAINPPIALYPPSVGRWIQVLLTVSNTGGVTASSVNPTLYVSSTPGGLVELISAPPALGPLSINANTATVFVWTYSVSGAGSVMITGTATGLDSRTSAPISDKTVYWLPTKNAAALSSYFRFDRQIVSLGQWARIIMRTTNIGEVSANSITPSLTITAGQAYISATSLLGPSPAGPVDLDPGQYAEFTWSGTITGVGAATFASCSGSVQYGDIVFSGTASGQDSGTGNAIIGAAADYLRAVYPAQLSPALALVPRQQCGSTMIEMPLPPSLGQLLDVRLTVTNTGGNNADSLVPSLTIVSGAGLVSKISGPVPALVSSVAGACSTRFVWTYLITGTGYVEFSATIGGTERGLATSLSQPAVASGDIIARSWLVAARNLAPNPVTVGLTVTATLTVTNTGSVSAVNVTPSMVAETGAGLLQLLSSPPGPVTVGAGASTTFTWTYSVTGAGTSILKSGATWQDGATACTMSVTGKQVLTIQGLARLVGSLTANPAASPVRERVELRLLVTNNGTAEASNVFPAGLSVPVGASLVGLPDGPVPASPLTLAAGQSAEFTWRYVGQAPGTVQFSVNASGLSIQGSPMTLGAPVTAMLELLAVRDAMAYPNPFNPAECAAAPCRLKFHNLAAGATVRIYTVSGLLVWEETEAGVPVAWDGRNKSGEEVAPGIYLFLIEDSSGRQTGKIVLKR